jgi:hypothetical protein
VKNILDTIVAGQHVAWTFYFGDRGPEGLLPEVKQRFEYIYNLPGRIPGGGSRTE